MRWILIIFAVAVAGLCLLCDDSGVDRARREAVRVVPVPVTGPEIAPTSAAPEPPTEADEAPPQKRKPELQPADPLGQGDCSLFLSLTSLESGEAVQSHVRLYRLDAPGNEHWFPGDQQQVRVLVPQEGVWMHRLPEGRYRLHAAAQRHPSDDPGPFAVRGEVTEQQLALPMPRKYGARLVIVGERGQPVTEAVRRAGFTSRRHRKVKVQWLHERRLRDPERQTIRLSGGSGGRYGGRRRWIDVWAEDGAFDLGRFREDPRSHTSSMPWRFRIPERTEVRVRRRAEPGRDQTYMAITVPPRALEESVRFPDGRAVPAESISIYGDAVLVPDPSPVDFWTTLTLTVEVQAAGFEPLKFVVDPQKPPVMRYLSPIAAKQRE